MKGRGETRETREKFLLITHYSARAERPDTANSTHYSARAKRAATVNITHHLLKHSMPFSGQ